MIGQQQITFVTRQALDVLGTNVEKHLLRRRRDDFQRPITNYGLRFNEPIVSRDDRLHHAHGVFTWRAARVSSAIVVIISEEPARFAVSLDAARPIHWIVARIRIGDRRALADVFSDLAAVAAGVQRRDDAVTVWSNPVTDIERNAARSFLERAAAADRRRRIPRELLRREPF